MIFDTSGKGDMYTIDDIASPLILYSKDLTELNDSSTLSDILGDRDPATITTVYFPNLTSIGNGSNSFFEEYVSLERVILPLCTNIKKLVFSNLKNLKYLYAPKVTNIGNSAFFGCTSLTSVDLPEITNINSYVFENCTSLTSVDLPKVISIGASVFFCCSSLASIDLPLCTDIDASAFYGCTSLTSISIPKATTINGNAFNKCTSLASIDLPLCTDIDVSTFYGCTSLTSISIPKATTINAGAFNKCTSLASISIPEATTISADAFSKCTSLASVDLPKVTNIIGSAAFYGCTSLTSVDLPLCTMIGYYVFENCTSLTSVDLPLCTMIGFNGFNGCTSLKLINLTNTSTVCTLSSTSAIPSGCYIQVPSSLLSSYKSATNWSSIASRIVASGTYSFTTPDSPSKVEMLNTIYPIGSIYMSVNNVSPASFLGGAWTQLTNRFLVGAGSSYSVNSTGGSNTHTHKYGIQLSEYYGDISLATTSTGLLSYNSSGAISGVVTSRTSKGNLNAVVNNNATTASKTVSAVHYTTESNTAPTSTLPPYLAVYMWKRVL